MCVSCVNANDLVWFNTTPQLSAKQVFLATACAQGSHSPAGLQAVNTSLWSPFKTTELSQYYNKTNIFAHGHHLFQTQVCVCQQGQPDRRLQQQTQGGGAPDSSGPLNMNLLSWGKLGGPAFIRRPEGSSVE